MNAKNLVEEGVNSISAHLARATVYASCAQAIIRQDQKTPDLLAHGRPFFSVVVRSLVESAILNIWHCVDNDRRASGFDCLFRRIRKHPTFTKKLEQQIEQDRAEIKAHPQLSNLTEWRKRLIAHIPNRQAEQKVPLYSCNVTEIRSVIRYLQTLLNHYATHICYCQVQVTSCGRNARGAFHRMVEMIEEGAEFPVHR